MAHWECKLCRGFVVSLDVYVVSGATKLVVIMSMYTNYISIYHNKYGPFLTLALYNQIS